MADPTPVRTGRAELRQPLRCQRLRRRRGTQVHFDGAAVGWQQWQRLEHQAAAEGVRDDAKLTTEAIAHSSGESHTAPQHTAAQTKG